MTVRPDTVQRILDEIDAEFVRPGVPAGFPDLPRIPAARYLDEDFFALEVDALRRCWVCVGSVFDLSSAGDYKVVDRWGGAAVLVVRGDDDVIRAFYNTCQHRGAPVVRDECGRAAKLRCQFHSWTYALDGSLASVPGRRDFPDSFSFADNGLRPVRCEVWRGFVFVNLDPGAPSLAEWLGPIAGDATWLDGLRTVATSSMELACNWKIGIESNIEVYHITTVHPTTVARSLDYRGTTHELYGQGHSRMVVPNLHYDTSASRSDAAADPDPVRALMRHANVSYLLFPFHLMPSGGGGITLQTFWPLTVDRTLMEWSTMVPDWGDGDAPELGAQRNLYYDKVMAEDTKNMEPVQASLRSPSFDGILTSYHERRIYHHEASIDRLIGLDRVPEHLRVPQLLPVA
jgi:phenylpropionate dioxygenase-like ring-hydroxylating dioxygenase large terminal subunit